MDYVITGLDAAAFIPLFACSDEGLSARSIVRRTVDTFPGYPCRISLQDAPIGERVLLLNYEHLSVASPYRASHAIYVREHVATAHHRNEVPEVMQRRVVSLRAFDADGMLVDADLATGHEIDANLRRLLALERVVHVDLHYAKPGCFAGRATPMH